MNQTNQRLLQNLIEAYGDYASYQKAIALLSPKVKAGLERSRTERLPAAMQPKRKGVAPLNGFAIPAEVLSAFAGDQTISAHSQLQPEATQASPKGIGDVSVHNLLSEPVLLHPESTAVYIGRANPKQGFKQAAPLANLSCMKGHGQVERDRVCDEDIERCIRDLEKREGPRWDEMKRLALWVRKGNDLRLLCYCAPCRCHGDGRAIAIRGLASRRKVAEIIQDLRLLLPAEQKTLEVISNVR